MRASSLFEIQLGAGPCVGLSLGDGDIDLEQELHDDERAHLSRLGARRRATFGGGRAAARRALLTAGEGGASSRPILPDLRGAPHLDDGPPLSISHKDDVAVALVGSRDLFAVGVDVEHARVRERDISAHVLTDDELANLGAAGMPRDLEVVLRFSLKEALYKVLDPFVHRYVGFKEVEVAPEPEGHARVCLVMKGDVPDADIVLEWRRIGDFFLSTATARRR